MRNKPIGIKEIQKRQTRVSECADMSRIALDESSASICKDHNTRDLYIESMFSNCVDEQSSSRYLGKMINMLNECNSDTTDKRHSDALVGIMTESVVPAMATETLKSDAFIKLSYGKDEIMNAVNEAIYCDRVISNDKKISKRFNADIYVREHQFYTDHHKMYHTICEWINTYNMPGYAKLSTSLDEISYLFQKNNIQYDSKDMVTYVTEFFIMDPGRNKTGTAKRLRNALEENMMISESDVEGVDYLFEAKTRKKKEKTVDAIIKKCKAQDNIDDKAFLSAIRSIYVDSPANIVDGTPNVLKWIRQLIVMSTLGINVIFGALVIMVDKIVEMNLNRKEIIRVHKAFMKEKAKIDEMIEQEDDPDKYDELKKYSDKLDAAIASIYTKAGEIMDTDELTDQDKVMEEVSNSIPVEYDKLKAEAVINDIKNITEQIYSKYASSLIGHGAAFVNNIVAYMEYSAFSKLCVRVHGETDNIWAFDCIALTINSNNESDNEDVVKYINEVMLPDLRESECPYSFYINTGAVFIELHIVYKSQIIVKPELNPGFSDESFSLDDQYKLYEFYNNCNKIDRLTNARPETMVNDIIESNLDTSMISYIIEMAKFILSDDQFRTDDSWMQIMSKYYQPYGESTGEEYVDKVASNNRLALGMYSLDEAEETNYPLEIQIEAYENIRKIINEEFDLNSVKIALQGMKDKVKTLSSKEKEASNNIDIAANNFIRSAQSALTNNRREAIIKGSLIPSFSKCIKAAIGVGAIGAVGGPALAVISVFSGLAISKHLNDRERTLMLDEIETELQVVEKELQMAENDNDMTRYRKLLTYQKRLKKEAFKIRYKLSRKAKRNLVTRGSEDGTAED